MTIQGTRSRRQIPAFAFGLGTCFLMTYTKLDTGHTNRHESSTDDDQTWVNSVHKSMRFTWMKSILRVFLANEIGFDISRVSIKFVVRHTVRQKTRDTNK